MKKLFIFRTPCSVFEVSNIIKIIMDCVGFIEQLTSELFASLEYLILNCKKIECILE